MQIKTTIVALVATLMTISCSSGGASKSAMARAELANESDSLAYIVGINIAEQLQKMDSTINYAVVCRAILDRFESKPLMSDDEARLQYLRHYLYVEPERRRGYEERFLADLAANDRTFTRTKTGLTYHIDVIGDEKLQPKSNNDWVVVNFTISRVGGEQLYPETEGEQTTIEMAVEDLPLGIAESLKLIGKGGKIKSWIPSKLAYGEYGNEEYGVEPTETLYFDMELVDVEKGAAAEKKKALETF